MRITDIATLGTGDSHRSGPVSEIFENHDAGLETGNLNFEFLKQLCGRHHYTRLTDRLWRSVLVVIAIVQDCLLAAKNDSFLRGPEWSAEAQCGRGYRHRNVKWECGNSDDIMGVQPHALGVRADTQRKKILYE